MSARVWTAAEIRALGTRTDLVTACAIVFGCGKNKAWEMYHAGELPFPAIRARRRVVCPVHPLLELLGIGDATANASPSRRLGAIPSRRDTA